jgi:hypothetical protein
LNIAFTTVVAHQHPLARVIRLLGVLVLIGRRRFAHMERAHDCRRQQRCQNAERRHLLT